jgi:diguanylate cyclase (GGDEF)-like protein/hemerythrin-like metal-binding protein
MQATAKSAAPTPDQVLLESFMNFPAPLVMADAEGHPQLVNHEYTQRFGDGIPDLDELLAAAGGAEAVTTMHGGRGDGARTWVRTVRTQHGVLMIFTEFFNAGDGVQFTRLQSRVTELERLVATDYLTGAWNRAHLDRVISTELARSMATRQPLTLVLFDVDHFKRINDTLGHAAGDAVLRELVDCARSQLRSSDLLFRWGGEEFVVLVAGAGYRAAAAIAEQLRHVVARREFPVAGRVTISIGIAEYSDSETPAAWFRRLDAALYEAKESGRNRIVVDRRGNSDIWAAQSGQSALHLIWQEGYESGHPVIDEEHRELFRVANVLIDAALARQNDGAEHQAALGALLEHVVRHFDHEEQILAEHDYVDLAAHKRAHAGLLARAQALRLKVEQGEEQFGAIVEYLAQDVVARHLMVVDRAFFSLFAPGSALPTN